MPVLFDGSGDVNDPAGKGGMSGMVRLPTRWAWRQEELIEKMAALPRGLDFARRANYSAFALPFFAADLMSDQLPHLVKHLVALATKPAYGGRRAALRHAVGQAAPLMRWAPPSRAAGSSCEHGGEPCDAFSALVLTLHAIRSAQPHAQPQARPQG